MLLLLGLAALAAATTNEDSWSDEDSWSEGNDTINLTVPKLIELKIKHTSSPLFIQSAASNGVTKLGFDATKFVELQNKAYDAQGQEFTVDNFLGIDGAESKPLSLKAFEVFAEDAKLVQMNEDGTDTEIEKPTMLHLRGSISGDPSSLVLLHMSPKASFGTSFITRDCVLLYHLCSACRMLQCLSTGMAPSSKQWFLSNALPSPRIGLHAISLSNAELWSQVLYSRINIIYPSKPILKLRDTHC